MKFIYPRDIFLSFLPKMEYRLDDDTEYDAVVSALVPMGDVEITPQLIKDIKDATCIDYLYETVGNMATQSIDIMAAVLIVAPYDIFMGLVDTVVPTRRYNVLDRPVRIITYPVFKQMWTQLECDEYQVEQKLAEMLSRDVSNPTVSHSSYIKQFSDEKVKRELHFLDNPSKYVKYLPEIVGNLKWPHTASSIGTLRAADLECIADRDWTEEMFSAVVNQATCIYDITPHTTPLLHAKMKKYLHEHFEGNYSVKVENVPSLRTGSRGRFLALVYLNRGEVLETDYYITKFGELSLDLYKREHSKLSRNGSFGAFGRPRSTSSRLKPTVDKSIRFEMQAIIEDKPNLTPGLYLSGLNRTHGSILKQLTPEPPVLTDVYNYNNVDSKYIYIKPTTTDKLTLLKEQRMLYHIARNDTQGRVIIVSELFDAVTLTAMPNVSLISVEPNSLKIDIISDGRAAKRLARRPINSRVVSMYDVAFLNLGM